MIIVFPEGNIFRCCQLFHLHRSYGNHAVVQVLMFSILGYIRGVEQGVLSLRLVFSRVIIIEKFIYKI